MLFAFCKVIVDELVEERSSSVSAHIQLRNLETCSSNAAGSNGFVMYSDAPPAIAVARLSASYFVVNTIIGMLRYFS